MLSRVNSANLAGVVSARIRGRERVGQTLRSGQGRLSGDGQGAVQNEGVGFGGGRRSGDDELVKVQPQLANVGRAFADFELAAADLVAGGLEIGAVLAEGRAAVAAN